MPPKKRVKPKAPEPAPEPELEEEDPLTVAGQDASQDDDEDAGVTRCVCGLPEDDYGFMVQCDTCKVWQHGFCVGYTESELKPHQDYYCEICRPDLHVNLLKNLRKNQKGHTSASSSSHDPQSLKVATTTMLPSTTVSTSQSRSSRSPSPPLRSNASHKRRNTLNSGGAAFDEAVASNNLEKLIADGQDDKPGSRASRKRKRSGGVAADDSASIGKRKRSSETPVSATSEQPNLADVEMHANENASANGSIKADTTARRGKRVKKEKETSFETEGSQQPPPVKAKQPNQYTNRAKPNNANPSPSKSTSGRTGVPDSVGPDPPPSQSSAPRRNQANPRPIANSPPPAPPTWSLPDHLSHLADLLPTPNPQGIEVRMGPGMERITEKPAKVKWPLKRTTIGEMRRRVRAMMEFVTKAQADVQEREKRVKALEEARRAMEELKGKGKSKDKATGNEGPIVDTEMTNASILPTTEPVPAADAEGEQSGPAPPPSVNASVPLFFGDGGTTAQLLASLTQDLINFQEKFGAGPGGKLYRDRERRPRGAAAAAVAAMERDE